MTALSEWLLAAPWWLLATAGAAALALLLFALVRTSRRLRWGGILAAVAIAVWALLSYRVETPTEMAVKRTREMVEAYEQSNWERLGELVDEETRFANLLRGQEIVEAARHTQEAIGHTPITIAQVQTRRDDVGVLVIVRVRAQPAGTAAPLTTAWRFDYRTLADQWRLERIDPIPTEHVDESHILRNLRLPPELQNRRR